MDPVDVMVRVGECPCPNTPHSEEHVYLEPELTLPMAGAATAALRWADDTVADKQAALIQAYFPSAIRSWTFLELGEGKRLEPVPVTRANMERLLPWDKGGFEVIDQADTLYSAALMRPLVKRISKLSERGRTGSSTSRTKGSGSRPRKQSAPSSQNGSAGKPFVAPDL